MGAVALFRGDFVAARAHLERALSLSDTPQPSAPLFPGGSEALSVIYLPWLMQVLWTLGYTDQAQQRSAEALALAQQCGEPPNLTHAQLHAYVHAQLYSVILAQYRRDAGTTSARAEAMMVFATAQGLMHRVIQGRLLLGWALAI
jgi:hypothetical protein